MLMIWLFYCDDVWILLLDFCGCFCYCIDIGEVVEIVIVGKMFDEFGFMIELWLLLCYVWIDGVWVVLVELFECEKCDVVMVEFE